MAGFKITVALSMLCAAPLFAAEIPSRYPASAFGQLPLFETPQLSPDGTRIAAKAAVNGQQVLVIVPVGADGKPVVAAVGKSQIDWVRWANNDRLLVSLGADDTSEGKQHAFRITRLVSIDRNGGNPVKLNWQPGAQFGDQVIDRGHSKDSDVLLSSSTTMYPSEDGYFPAAVSVNVATGRLRTLVHGRDPIFSWSADSAGAVRAGFGYVPSINAARLIYRRTDSEAFTTIARAKLNKDERLPSPVLIRPGSDVAVLIGERNDHAAVIDYDLQTGIDGATIWSNPKYDAETVILSSGGSDVAGVYFTADREKVDWLDPELAKLQADLDKSVAPASAYVVSLSADNQRLIVLVSSPTNAGSFYLLDRAEGVMHRFAARNDQLKGAVLAPMTEVHYAARDGLAITAYLTLPVGRAPRGLPLIVMPHGGPAARDALDYDFWVQFLANRGYAVLQPNFRGSTGYGAKFHAAGDGEWGLKMQDDVTDGVRWLAAQGIADIKRVCINGGSYGGYAALQGTVRDPGLYRCAISFAGVSDMKAMDVYDSNFLFGKNYSHFNKKSAPDFAAVSPVNHVDMITTPILLVHGKMDQTVPFDQSQSMARALKRADKPFEFVIQPEGDHHLSRQADRIQLLEASEAFLTKYNPAD